MKMQTRIGYSTALFCKYFNFITMTDASQSHLFNSHTSSLLEAMARLPVNTPFKMDKQEHQVSFATIANSNLVAKLVMFGEVNWHALFELMAKLDNKSLSVQIKRPSEALAGAVVVALSEQLALQEQQALMKWAEEVEVELCYVDSSITIEQPGLIVMDMDSTAIEIECIDEIAKLAGVGEQVAKVTAQAMRGELDFAESLRARVATLKDAPISIIDEVANNLPLMPGLENLVAALQQKNWKVVIASGGFTYMTDKLKQQLGLDKTVANQLGMTSDKLTGEVHGAIVDAQTKADTVLELAQEWGIPLSQTIAMGDGANDLVMMKAAELGVAFHAKPLVREQADVSVRNGGLDQLLYLI